MKKLLIVNVFVFFNSFNIYSQKLSVDIVSMLPKSYVKDASVDYTKEVQEALNLYDSLIFPDFPILINDKGLTLKSNQYIYFNKGGAILMKESEKSHYSVIILKDIKNVTIENLVVKGDRSNHLGKDGEWGMGISILGSSNVFINNATISDCWGDGIYIGRNNEFISRNILIRDTSIDFCRRNGISIISADLLEINNVKTSNINGTLPMAGIDIEPNSSLDYIGKIYINDFSSEKSVVGIQIGLRNYPTLQDNRNAILIHVKNFISFEDSYGILYGDYFREYYDGQLQSKILGDIYFENIIIKNYLKEPIKYYNKYGYKFSPVVNFNKVKIENDSIQSMEEILLKLNKDFKERDFKLEN